MMVRFPYALAAALIWVGFVCAISFMEAWLKFRAPGITLPLGLGIGRLVFSALNKVEWFLAFVIGLDLLIMRKGYPGYTVPLFALLAVILIIQTAWLLPALDARAELHIAGSEVPPSPLHLYYIALEFLKVAALGLFSIFQFQNIVP